MAESEPRSQPASGSFIQHNINSDNASAHSRHLAEILSLNAPQQSPELMSTYYCDPRLTEEETEAWRGPWIGLRSQSW